MTSQENLNFPKYLDKQFFEKIIHKHTKNTNVSIKELKVGMGCENGDNFCSIVYRVQMKFIRSNGKYDELSWIVKSMPYEAERAVLKEMFLYKKETDMYFDILPTMEKLIGQQLAPRCYYATQNPIDTIVFQDLKPLGLEQINKADALDEQHCRIVLSKLGKFHAASLYLAEKNPNCFENFRVGLFSGTYFEPQQMRDFFMGTYNTVCKLVKEWPGFETIARKLQALERDYLKKVAEVFESEAYSYKVLNHGDLWSNNLFFKYDVNRLDSPVDCLFIDFQGCIFNSPGIDLNYFLNMSVHLDVLQNKREYILKEYYFKSFKEKCEELRVQKVPSFEDTQKEIESREFFGVFVAIGSALLSTDKDSSQEICLENIVDKKMSDKLRTLVCSTEKFQTKMQYILRRADSLGLLN